MLRSFLFGARKGPRPAPRPSVERLEERCAPSATPNPATVPAPNADPTWAATIRILTHERRGNPRVVFLGDSITQFFADGAGTAVWRHRIARLHADDFAIRSSTTQNVLYEINQGILSNLNARVVVLMIGINNLLTGETPQQTATGVAACLTDIHAAQPRARIVLLGLLPAGWTANSPLRIEAAQTDALLPAVTDGRVARYVDVSSGFLGRNGSIAPDMLLDGIHPTERGYIRIADNLDGLLWALVDAPPLPPPPPPPSPGHGGQHP